MRGVASKTVNANDGTGNHTWNYSYHVGSVLTNTVTDPLGNDTVYTMTGLGGSLSFYPTEVDYYQGSQTTGTLLKKVTKAYQYQINPCSPSAPKEMVGVLPTKVTTIWGNGQQAQTTYTYDAKLPPPTRTYP